MLLYISDQMVIVVFWHSFDENCVSFSSTLEARMKELVTPVAYA